MKQNKAELLTYLEPEQQALSEAGCHKVLLTVRTLLEENPNFVCLKLDIRNAQNSMSRAKCVERLEQIAELRHLAWHAATVLAPVTTLHANGERIGESQDGFTQGDPEATPLYCATWHEEVRQAEEELKQAGGAARFISDDGYLVGPEEQVIAAFREFERDIWENCGLRLQVSKCEIFCRDGVLPLASPQGVTLAGAQVNGQFEPGFLCVGVPVGSDSYVRHMMDQKLDQLEDEVEKTLKLLGDERQALWTILRASTLHKLE